MKKVSVSDWAEELKILRAAKVLTQDKLAAVLEVSSSIIGFWETGKVTPSKVTMAGVRAICAAEQSSPAGSKIIERKRRRYSKETLAALHEGLDVIVDHAPDATVREVIDFLSERAVRYRELSHAFGPPEQCRTPASSTHKRKMRKPPEVG